MKRGKKLLACAAVFSLVGWSTAFGQQRIKEGDAGNPCKIAQVVGRDDTEPYDDVVISYDQPLTEVVSKRGDSWAVGAIGKASAGIGLGPDGCRGTADDQPNPTDFQVYNTRRDVRCPTASSIFLDGGLRQGLPHGWFYAAVGHGDRLSDFPVNEGIEATDIIGYKVELGTTADPNLVHVTRALTGTDKIYWSVDIWSDGLRMVPGQIANDGSVVGRMDDYDIPQAGDDVIWRLNIESTITSGSPYEFNFTNYNVAPPGGPAMLTEADPGVLTGPNLDAYDSDYVMGNTFTANLDWTTNGGSSQSSVSLLTGGATETRGAPGFNSDYRPSIGTNPTSRGTGALHAKTATGRTDGIIVFEVDDAGIIATNHYVITYPATMSPCDDPQKVFDFIQGAHYHGSSAFGGPFDHLAVNKYGHIVAPTRFGELNQDGSGRDQALIWTDGDAQNPVWGVVAYHGQAWDPVNCQTAGVPWILGLDDPLETYPFSNPTLDQYDNVFFICPYKISDTQTGVGLFRAAVDHGTSPPCWTIDLILSEFDDWQDDNGVEILLTDLNSVGASGMPANGTIGSNSLVDGLLPGVSPVARDFDPSGPESSGGVVFNGTTLVDETPPENYLTEEACNDDNAGECVGDPPNDPSDSSLSLAVSSGTTYLIEVTSRTYNGPGGTLDFYLECDDGLGDLGTSGNPNLLAHDECTGAAVIPVGDVAFSPVLQDTTVATLAESDPYQSCTILYDGVSTGYRRNSHSVWYSYTPDKDCTLTVQTCGSTPNDPDTTDPNDNDLFYNTVVTVYTGGCGPSSTDPLINDGLKAKGRFATANGFTFTAQSAGEISNVVVRDSLEIVSGGGTVVPDFYEIIAIDYGAGSMTLSADAGISAGDVVWQVNDNQFFGQLLYVKAWQTVPEPGCICGDVDGSGGLVDLGDFATFALCYGLTGPAGDCTQQGFDCSDLDGSGEVSLDDFATFALYYGLASTNTVPNCPQP